MAKSFKKFRQGWDDDEWGDDEDYGRKKDRKLEKRRKNRRKKMAEKFSALEENLDNIEDDY